MKGIRMCALMACALAVVWLPVHADDGIAGGPPLFSSQHGQRSTVRAITMKEAEDAALAANAELRVAARRVATAESQVPTAGRLPDAQFMYRNWQTPLARPWDLNQSQHMFMLSRQLPATGVRPLQRQVAAEDVEIRRNALEARKRDVLARVRAAYYALVRNRHELTLHDEQVAIAQQSIESSRIKYTVGKVAQQDVLKAQISTTKLVEHLLMLEQDGDTARAGLNTLMGRDPATPLEVAGEPLPARALPALSNLESTALRNRPELAAIAAQIRQAETRVGLARRGLSPEYSVSGGYMLMPGGSERRNAYMAELSVSLPWANRKKHEAEIAAAVAEVEGLRVEFEAERALVFNEIQQALVRANTASRLVRLYGETLIPETHSAFRAAVTAYQNDRTDLLNLLESQNMILDVRTSHYRAQAEYESAIAELERAIGTELGNEVRP